MRQGAAEETFKSLEKEDTTRRGRRRVRHGGRGEKETA